MYYRLTILLFSTLFIACATNKPIDQGPSLDERMAVARKALDIVKPGENDWCNAGSQCQFLGMLTCAVEKKSEKSGKKTCMKKLKQATVQLGGDRFVLQARGMPNGQETLIRDTYQYRAYGRAYKCSDKNVALGKEAMQEYSVPSVSSINVYSSEYFTQCKLAAACKKVKDQNCSSIRDEAFNLCVKKHESNRNIGTSSFNTLVINHEVYNKMGAYRMFGTIYTCQ